ncbi:hypothetical protein CTheo_8742 [Ceratobasidium theobromae]|uniref:Uncharacterized protein n=1 Tax=Ceratobasidium theobromae TaxID=1582974 RepID=A0A5N5Q8R9_9AGAM|nr:hypothetical protein CTheo_8742 [Ceratobasidium theobromae]
MDADCLANHQVQTNLDHIIDDVKKAKDPENNIDDADNPAKYWDTPRFTIPGPLDIAREAIFNLPKSPGKLWLEEWFQDAIKLGIHKQQGNIAHAVARKHEKIFGINNTAFNDHALHKDLPEVQQLLENFMHIGEEDEDGHLDLSRFFRDTCIVCVL